MYSFSSSCLWASQKLLILCLGVVTNVSQSQLSAEILRALEPFTYSMLLLGSFVGFVGLLILSWRGLKYEKNQLWILYNAAFLTVTVSCVWFGNLYSVPVICGMACWIGFFWLIEKLTEIELGTWGWVFKLAGVSAACYALIQVIEHYPQFFQITA